MKQTEMQYLEDVALAVSRELHCDSATLKPFSERRMKAGETDTNGWYVSLGKTLSKSCDLEIWFDYYLGLPKRTVYYGFYSENEKEIQKLSKLGIQSIGKHYELHDKNVLRDTHRNIKRLHKPLTEDKLGRPCFERYIDEGNFFYGVFENTFLPLKQGSKSQLVMRIACFFETVIKEFSNSQNSDSDQQFYAAIENRKLVTMHLRRERNSYLANMRKKSDKYRCQICKFRFQNFYGLVGRDFAEVHHIIPLASSNKVRHSTINDLITVCANCHRMLHRLQGSPDDVTFLKNRIAASRGMLSKKVSK